MTDHNRSLSRRRLLAACAGASIAWGAGPARRALAQETSTVDLAQASGIEVARTRYFAATGHNLTDPFRTRWEQSGGVETLGQPLSEERWATGAGGVLQTFENITLVYDPGQEAPFDVHGQRLDKTLWLTIAPREAFARVDGSAGGTLVGESGHTITGAIADFWSGWGGEAIFGKPLTQPVYDPSTPDAMGVQLFEHAVLEDYGGSVRLRPMGRILAEASGLFGDPAFQPAPPTGGQSFLVASTDGLNLRSGPNFDAPLVRLLENNAEFIADPEWSGDWASGYADGLSGYVATSFLVQRPPLPQIDPASWDLHAWQGAALSDSNVRAQAATSAEAVRTLAYGEPVTVRAWVTGEEAEKGDNMWAELTDGTFVYARNLGRNAPVEPTPLPPDAPQVGRWIDVNLTQQLMTAYDGQQPMKTVPITSGKAGWETPSGTYSILNRVANETMTSGAIGADNHYRLEDVLFTQYFTDMGHAIHFAWWRTKETIGRPGSHGCLNVLLEDARYFWDFADYGTPLIVHL
ncbi:MAG: L,D-transpeptidase family protein [Thermomicrobiales bacterium]